MTYQGLFVVGKKEGREGGRRDRGDKNEAS